MLTSKRLRIKQAILFNNPTLFCVGEKGGQKYVYDMTYRQKLAYSSGQQQKTSFVNEMHDILDMPLASFVFYYNKNHKQVSKGILADPRNFEAMIRGYMNVTTSDIKRESPLNISTMFPIHPLLIENNDDTIAVGHGIRQKSFTLIQEKKKSKPVADDESEGSTEQKSAGTYEEVPKTSEEYKRFLDEMVSAGKTGVASSIAGSKLLTKGIFVRTVEIDLTRLFAFNNDIVLPCKEVAKEYIEEITKEGWKEINTKLYGKMYIVPKNLRDKYIPAIAEALVKALPNTNKSSSASEGEIIATAVSYDASENNKAIRCKQVKDSAVVVFDKSRQTELFIGYPAESSDKFTGYSEEDINVDADKDAIAYITQELLNFDYEGI